MTDSETKQEVKLQGVAAAPGVARGGAFVFLRNTPEIPRYIIPPERLNHEIQRFENALVNTRAQISQLRETVANRLGEAQAGIFDAHLLVLDDPALIDETLSSINGSMLNAEHCFHTVAEKYIAFFSKIEDEYFKERVVDIRDVSQRILHNLLGLSPRTLADLTNRRVIVAEDVTPSDTASLETGHVFAIITDAGNRTSHAVIMARSLRIPAVVALIDASKKIAPDDFLLVDGYAGIVYVNPSPETLSRYEELEREHDEFNRKVLRETDLPDLAADRRAFSLSANVCGAEDIDALKKYRANGVGLFRTEAVFIKNQSRIPDEETQLAAYRALVEGVAPATVVIRTLDIGGDKAHGALQASEHREENPFMGFRAIRFCLENKSVFRTQLRAVLRASAFGKTKIMFPMISSLDELLQAKAFLRQIEDELRAENIPFDEKIPVGAMIEIPAAAICAESLAEHADFFSIGTNDLVQYTLAVDRGNERIAHLYEPCNPAVLLLIRHIIVSAKKKNVPVSVCGELAGDPAFASLLFALGADSLSMTSGAIPEIRYLLRRTTSAELEQLVTQVYAETNPQKISAILKDFAVERLK